MFVLIITTLIFTLSVCLAVILIVARDDMKLNEIIGEYMIAGTLILSAVWWLVMN